MERGKRGPRFKFIQDLIRSGGEAHMPRWSVGSLCGRRLAQPGDNGGDEGGRKYQLGAADDVLINVFVMSTKSNIC